jgi:hypothetical protein
LVNERRSKKQAKHKHKHSIYSVQQTAVLGTSNIMCKVLQCKTGVLGGGDSCWFGGRGSRERKAVTGENNNNNNNNKFTKADRGSLYIKRKQEGNGLLQINVTNNFWDIFG